MSKCPTNPEAMAEYVDYKHENVRRDITGMLKNCEKHGDKLECLDKEIAVQGTTIGVMCDDVKAIKGLIFRVGYGLLVASLGIIGSVVWNTVVRANNEITKKEILSMIHESSIIKNAHAEEMKK